MGTVDYANRPIEGIQICSFVNHLSHHGPCKDRQVLRRRHEGVRANYELIEARLMRWILMSELDLCAAERTWRTGE
jgi:hypothetical protein